MREFPYRRNLTRADKDSLRLLLRHDVDGALFALIRDERDRGDNFRRYPTEIVPACHLLHLPTKGEQRAQIFLQNFRNRRVESREETWEMEEDFSATAERNHTRSAADIVEATCSVEVGGKIF